MSTQSKETVRPSVIIIGAGFGGLLLAVLLEQINIPYHIFERAKELRPLGGVMTMGANILPVFEQLGLLNEIMKISKFFKTLKLYNPDMSEMATQDILGYYSFLFSRPKLYEILLSQVPADRISLNKKALSTKEKDGKVTISFSDDTTYEGDIVVGADGAYSGVRQSLYKHLDAEGLLPKADSEAFSIGYITMVGVSDIKNPEKYPELNDPFVQFPIVISGDYKIWNAVFTPGNKICWTLGQQLSQEESKDQHFRNSEWGPESNESMIKEFQDKLCPLGGKMGDLIENTPKDRISKVFLEEKVFQTWYHGRIVLLGDAAHKLNPAGGFGAVSAFQDSVVLANCLYEMKDASSESITSAFGKYHAQRYHLVQGYFYRSQMMSKITAGQKFIERVIRQVMFKYIPVWMFRRDFIKSYEYCPTIAWLPSVKKSRDDARP